ncbi:hypothetical protein sscle_04g038760 [Sclerotinia sclerotiorum 1980 UF-70]|uniref:Uncharacterized protein n=2 Tax=Sclerotinia sclerotiorum (strain ATCC 18683 / 1980 / Ss-1) TaxID=665079 RepID=A0A1D9Q2I8_SCLS1|nr:hypothetical protein sscle_04g038760 [Sclerotinia sclerotiorum 1980 UF-70]
MMLYKRYTNVFVGVFLSTTLYFLWFSGILTGSLFASSNAPPVERPVGPIYKDLSSVRKRPPINDNFPLAGLSARRGDLPAIPSWNRPPSPHVNESTPLFIGFTRNWRLLQQVVLSYITSGWPPEDIYVVDNTGTMRSNYPPGQLTLQNPFYLNMQRLTEVFGVNAIYTPTLFTFAQLQNFYLFTAVERGWDYYWWSHMDIVALTEEKYEETPFKSLYMRAVDKLREVSSPDYLRDPETGEKPEWAIQFFSYDWLALNNVKTFMKHGAYDPFISYYKADCDLIERFRMSGIRMPIADAGRIIDVGDSIDLNLFFRRKIDPANPPKSLAELARLPEDDRGGKGFDYLLEVLAIETDNKLHGEEVRNSWQYKQQGGQGEPFYRDPEGFEAGLQIAIEAGVQTYQEKWGHKECGLVDSGLKLTDAWKVEHDWVET